MRLIGDEMTLFYHILRDHNSHSTHNSLIDQMAEGYLHRPKGQQAIPELKETIKEVEPTIGSTLQNSRQQAYSRSFKKEAMDQIGFQGDIGDHTEMIAKAWRRLSSKEGPLKIDSHRDNHNLHDSLEQKIAENKLLTELQKKQFIQDLSFEGGLSALISSLGQLIPPSLMPVLTFLSFQIWEQYLPFKSSLHSECRVKGGLVIGMKIKNFDDWDDDNEERKVDCRGQVGGSIQLQPSEMEIIQAADQAAKSMLPATLQDKRLSLLTLSERMSEDVSDAFFPFLETLARSIFLVAEGYFIHPSSEHSRRQSLNYEQEAVEHIYGEEDVSYLNNGEDSDDEDKYMTGRKKRKM